MNKLSLVQSNTIINAALAEARRLNLAPLAVAVLDSGLCLYRSDRAADHAFARTARSRYADLRPFLERTRRLKLAALAR